MLITYEESVLEGFSVAWVMLGSHRCYFLLEYCRLLDVVMKLMFLDENPFLILCFCGYVAENFRALCTGYIILTF